MGAAVFVCGVAFGRMWLSCFQMKEIFVNISNNLVSVFSFIWLLFSRIYVIEKRWNLKMRMKSFAVLCW